MGVYRKEIDALGALAPRLLAGHPPRQAFRLWCDRLAVFGRTKHGVADVLRAAIAEPDAQGTYGPMLEAVGQLLKACEGAGDLRPGLEPQDFLLLVSHGQLQLGHVQPARVLGGVVELELRREPPRLGRCEGLVQGGRGVRAQVVEHHPDHRRVRVAGVGQVPHGVRESAFVPVALTVTWRQPSEGAKASRQHAVPCRTYS